MLPFLKISFAHWEVGGGEGGQGPGTSQTKAGRVLGGSWAGQPWSSIVCGACVRAFCGWRSYFVIVLYSMAEAGSAG